MELQAKAALVLGVALLNLLLALGAGWKGYSMGEDHAKAELSSKIEAADRRAEEIATRFEDKLANLKVVNRTVNNEVRREVEKQIYTDCRVPEGGRAVLGRAIGVANGWVPAGATADSLRESKPAGGLPEAAPAGK